MEAKMPTYVSGVSDLKHTPNGDTLFFTVQTMAGENIPLACRSTKIGKFIEDLLHLAVAASNQRSQEEIQAAIPIGPFPTNPIPTLGLGIGPGKVSTQVQIGIHLGIMNLVFSVSPKQLVEAVEGLKFRQKPKRPSRLQ
jgi:hypothetical protein